MSSNWPCACPGRLEMPGPGGGGQGEGWVVGGPREVGWCSPASGHVSLYHQAETLRGVAASLKEKNDGKAQEEDTYTIPKRQTSLPS